MGKNFEPEWHDQVRFCQTFLFSKLSFLQDVFNETKSRNIDSLHCLIAMGVLKTATAVNIAGSGLNLHHLQLIWQRDGEDGCLDVLSSMKNSFDKPRVTKEKQLLENISPKSLLFFFRNRAFTFYFVGLFTLLMRNIYVLYFIVNHIHTQILVTMSFPWRKRCYKKSVLNFMYMEK